MVSVFKGASKGTHVGIVNLESELVQFALDVAENAALENLTLGKDLLHGHARNQHTRLTLDDTLDDVLQKLVVVRRLGAAGARIG